MKKDKTSIIIPTFNEKGNIVKLAKEILRVARKNNLDLEIIVVDDNSPDKTAAAVRKNFTKEKRVRLFVRTKEKGLASAILFGIKRGRGEVILGMDADFNHPPSLIPKILEKLKAHDLIVASRFIKDGGMEEKGRYWRTLVFNLVLKHLLGFPTIDNMSGFYAISKEKLFKLPLKQIYRGYGEYHLRLLHFAKMAKLKISEVPVYYPKRKYGKSKSDLSKLVFLYTSVALKLSILGKD